MHLAVEAGAMAGDRRGIGRYVRQVLRHGASLRPDLRVTLCADRASDRQVLSGEALELGFTGGRGAVARLDQLARVAPDVVWYPWARIRSRPAAGHAVATIHDLAPFYLHNASWLRRLDRWRRQLRLRRTARLADRIITDSAFSRNDIIARLGVAPGLVTAIPLAADDFTPASTSDQAALAACFGIGERFLLYVGAGDRRKNLVRLVEAYGRLRARGYGEVTLVLCGPKVPRSAPPGVRWLGRVSDEDLRALYRAAVALVHPSLLEGFGLPVLEAMASGTLVICSNATSLPEVAGDAALYVDPMDVEGLAAAMERCLRDGTLRDSLRGRGLIQARKFSWEETARRTLAVFDQVLATR